MPPAFYATDCQLCSSNLGVANAAFGTKSRAQRGEQGRDGTGVLGGDGRREDPRLPGQEGSWEGLGAALRML